MARQNIKQQGGAVRGTSRSPLQTTVAARTHEGGAAVQHDDKSALFLLATGRFYGEDSFYETTHLGAQRFRQLVRTVAVVDPQWFAQFVRWLRNDGNIRTAAIVAAAEGADAWRKARITGTRDLVRSVLVRADEVGEFWAYWRANIGKSIPSGAQRALADRIVGVGEADAVRLYTERNAIKWDGSNNAYRFADVLELTHPKAQNAWQDRLFKYLLDERHHGDGQLDGLPMLNAYKEMQEKLRTDRAGTLRLVTEQPDLLRQAGMTWENLSSSGPMDKAAWEAIIPNMGYMALLRNLRNFDQNGVSDEVKARVAAMLSDPEQVARSRQLPFRFLSAYLEAQGHQWQSALETALQHSLRNIPTLDGKTVVLVDTSGSMGAALSRNSKITYAMAGGLFGTALAAAQGNAELVGFANGDRGRMWSEPITRGASVLRVTESFLRKLGQDGHGTNIAAATQYAGTLNPTRIVIVTDGQCHFGYVSQAVPTSIPIYAFNLAGYGVTAIESGATRHQLGGLQDSTFGLIKSIEAAQQGRWPWEA